MTLKILQDRQTKLIHDLTITQVRLDEVGVLIQLARAGERPVIPKINGNDREPEPAIKARISVLPEHPEGMSMRDAILASYGEAGEAGLTPRECADLLAEKYKKPVLMGSVHACNSMLKKKGVIIKAGERFRLLNGAASDQPNEQRRHSGE